MRRITALLAALAALGTAAGRLGDGAGEERPDSSSAAISTPRRTTGALFIAELRRLAGAPDHAPDQGSHRPGG